MKNTKLRNRILAVIAAMALILVAAIPVLAEDTNQLGVDPTVYEPISGTKAQFVKYLVLDNENNVPGDAVFSFNVDAGSGTAATATTLPVIAGRNPEAVVIYASGSNPVNPSGTVSFVGYSGTFTSGAAGAAITGDAAKKKYAEKTVIIDFSNVSFPLPGVYRYEISEENTLGYQTDSAKTLDVFVVNDETASGAKLKIDGYIMYDKTTTAGPVYTSGTTGETAFPSGTEKSVGFINKFPSVDLEVKKMVAGNQADKSEFFEFELNIRKASPNTEYTVDISNMVVENSASGTNGALRTEKIKTDADGKIENFTFKLQHGQSIKIYGLSEGTFYSVEEVAGRDGADLDEEGYTTKIAVTSNGDGNAVAEINDSDRTIVLEGEGESGSGIRQINTITFTNSKNGVLPTGVNMKVIPIVVISILFIAGISVLTVRMARKENEEE